jgi:FkbM family methyltransferase
MMWAVSYLRKPDRSGRVAHMAIIEVLPPQSCGLWEWQYVRVRHMSLAETLSPPTTASTFPPFGTYPPTALQAAVRNIGQRLPFNWPGRRASGWLRYLLQTTARRPIDVTVMGQRMRLRLRLKDNACERRLMVTPQFFDPKELENLRRVMRPDFQFVDVGANVGVYSVFVGTLAGPGARILAIEPQPQLVERLRENIALNGINVRIAPFAVADRDGEIEFAVDTNNFGFTSLNLSLERKGRGERRIVRLPVRRLIDLVRDAGFERIDALKVDIEGAEDLALLPFMEEAPQSLWPKLIIIENNPDEWRRNCVTFLKERGYRQIAGRSNIVLCRDAAAELAHDPHRLVDSDFLKVQPAAIGEHFDAGLLGQPERLGVGRIEVAGD